MFATLLSILFQFVISVFIRLGWHKYTTEKVYLINRYALVVLIIIGLYYGGLYSIPYICGFFIVEFLYYPSKYLEKEIQVKNLLANLIQMMPEKRETQDGQRNLDKICSVRYLRRFTFCR